MRPHPTQSSFDWTAAPAPAPATESPPRPWGWGFRPSTLIWLIERTQWRIDHAVEQAAKYPEWNEIVDMWTERKRELERSLRGSE